MKRIKFLNKIIKQFEIHPICAILGPRQAGKTTLAKMFVEDLKNNYVFLDLENPIDLAKLENPMLTLSSYENKLIIIDEIQRMPKIFPILRVLADDIKKNQKFLILGSASKDLINKSSETLAGRIGYVELTPFSFIETKDVNKLWLRGGFPRSFLASCDENSYQWREDYITTFLERDIPLLGFIAPPALIRRFWLMLSHYHGQIFNGQEIAKSLGITYHNVKRYLDILASTFMLRILTPWYENLKKRQIKSPKIYFQDSGLLHTLLGIHTFKDLINYPKMGSFWEGFALEEIIRKFDAKNSEIFFWATQSGAELDLLILKNGKKIGFEFKYSDKIKVTKSMIIAMNDLKLDCLYIIYPGDQSFILENNIFAYGLEKIEDIN
jgi:hypothetical protein